jgi:hypothetical protein
MISYVNLFSQDKLVNEKYKGYRYAVNEKPKFISKMINLLSDSIRLALNQKMMKP